MVNDNFEGAFPNTSACTLWDYSTDGFDRYWGLDSTRYYTGTAGTRSIWPARGGANGVNPATNNYPKNLKSWLICGPYDFTHAKRLMVRFQRWIDIPDTDGDSVFFGASTDSFTFHGASWSGVGQYWVEETLWFNQYEGQPQVWVALVFESDNDDVTGKGAWIDDLEVWRYNNPAITCGNLDPGNKGLHLPAYELTGSPSGWYPFIRAGETQALTGTVQTQTKWVRLPFLQKDGYAVDEQAYDRMVDSFCNAGISVLAMINDETLTRPREDANDPNKACSYRIEFANEAGWLAGYFKGRVKYWQVWNEPYHAAQLSISNYAALLTLTSNSIKTANPDAKVVSAGLEHAWNEFNIYLDQVYTALNNEQGGARPFDVFAIHPYPNDPRYGPDPMVYMHATDQMVPAQGDRTIIDKFVRTMESRGDTGKKVWVTEVGWSSALGQPNAEPMAVDRLTQAFYLQKEFDILFNEARSVDKVFWYKYWDENTPKSQAAFNRVMQGEDWRLRHPDVPSLNTSSPSVIVPGWYGLYTTNRLEPKPSRCAFIFYPQRCPTLAWFNFLPMILRGQ